MANVKMTYDLYDITNKNSTLKITCDNPNEASTLIEQLKKNGLTCIQLSGTLNNSFFIARVLRGDTEYGYYMSSQGEPSINCSLHEAKAIAELLGLEAIEYTINTYENNAAIRIKREIPDETKKKIISNTQSYNTQSYEHCLLSDQIEKLYSCLTQEQQNTIISSGQDRLKEILNALEITVTHNYVDTDKGLYFFELSDAMVDQLSDLLNNKTPLEPILTTSSEHTDNKTPNPTNEEAQETHQDQPQHNDVINTHQTLLDNCNRIKIKLTENIEQACSRLNTNSFWTSIGVASTGTAKIKALEELKKIIANPGDNLNTLLKQWKMDHHNTITKQRNLIHTFFSPAHQTTTLKKVTELFNELGLDYGKLDSLDTPSPKPSNEF